MKLSTFTHEQVSSKSKELFQKKIQTRQTLQTLFLNFHLAYQYFMLVNNVFVTLVVKRYSIQYTIIITQYYIE